MPVKTNLSGNQIKITDAEHLEVYLFYQKIDKAQKKSNFEQFFSNLDRIDHDLGEPILFLEADSALQYSRFTDNSHALLKAYVPQIAIEGRSNGLALKKGFLKKAHVHGFFPGWEKGMVYVENPFFDFELAKNAS